MMRLLVSCMLLIASVVADQQNVLPTCRQMTEATLPKYHSDAQCNRTAHNSNEKRLLRQSRYFELLTTGVSHIPDQLTITCPELPEHIPSAHGHDTKWIVENKSSGPAVIAYVRDGVEYSAFNTKITPPQADPEAILKPGDWMAVDTFEGHIFHVRELLEDGSTGNILLQHRPGLIGFKNRYHPALTCDESHEDIEPIIEVTPPPPPKTDAPVPKPKPQVKTDPKYARSPEHRGERCHIVYQGFRNLLPNCPLHVYYVGTEEPSLGPMQCREEFKFHLGLNDNTKDYMEEWDSRTKFEATLMKHSFVARLATNPDIAVDSFTLQPTEIHDCPNLKQKAISQKTTEKVIEPTGVQRHLDNTVNSTNIGDAVNLTSHAVHGVGSSSSQ